MKISPIISICMPTFNNSRFLKRQLRIIHSQTKNIKNFFFEFVICDNGSKDKTREVIETYKKKNISSSVNIKYYRNKKNIGYHRNLLKSIRNSNGKYLLFLGDDDLPGYNFYKELFIYLSKKEIEEIIVLPIDTCPAYRRLFFGYNTFSYLFMRFSQTSGILIKKNNFSKKGLKSNNLYLQVIFLFNYYFKFGVKFLDINSKICIRADKNIKVYDTFNDKMRRPKDFGLKERYSIVDMFLESKKINYIEYLWTKRALISWLLDLIDDLYKERKQKFGNNFLLYIYSIYNNKFLFHLLLITVLLHKIIRLKKSIVFIKIYFILLNNEIKNALLRIVNSNYKLSN